MDVVMGDAPGSAQDLAGLRSLEARGAVDARAQPVDAAEGAEAQRFEGERLTFAGATGTGRLEGASAGRARVTLGSGDLAQRIAAPTMDFAVSGGRISTATLAAPVVGMFHVAEAGRDTVERYVVKSDSGPIEVIGDGAVIHGTEAVPVVVERSVRDGENAPFRRSMTLAAPTVRIATDGADLGRGARSIRRFDAEGPGTRVEIDGSGGGTMRAMGDRIAYDPATARLRLTGAEGVQFLRTDAKGRTTQARFNWWTIDTRTGAVDMEGGEGVVELPK
jgi:lipopolysaccharide export system protein LptA